MSEAPDTTTTTTTTTVDPNATTTTAPATTWYTGADPELIGHIQTKGWHDLDAGKAALAAITAHREAEKFIGVPAERVAHLPKDASDAAGIAAFRAKIGVPTEAAKYDIGELKFADGTAPDAKFGEWLKETAFKAGIPQSAIGQIAQDFTKFIETASSAGDAEKAARLADGKAELTKNWGDNGVMNLEVAKRGAASVGISPEAVAALEATVGYAKTMEAFRQIGVLNGEAKFIGAGNGPGGNGGIMTREQAMARSSELKNDSAWVSRYLAGDTAANREMSDLTKIMVGDDTDESRRA